MEATQSNSQVESAKDDQHQRNAKFQAESKSLRDNESEHNDRAADHKECNAVSNAPKHPDDCGVSNIALAAYNCRYGDHVIGIGGVPHSEEESERENGKQCSHTLGAICVSMRRTDLMAHSWP